MPTPTPPPRPQPPESAFVPNVSPNYLLKAETADEYGLSDRARRLLYETPTKVYYTRPWKTWGWGPFPPGPLNPQRDPAYSAIYFEPDTIVQGPRGPIYVPEEMRRWPEGALQVNLFRAGPTYYPRDVPREDLMHEFAHKWYFEEVPSDVRAGWRAWGDLVAGPSALDEWEKAGYRLDDETSLSSEELYAYAAQYNRPQDMGNRIDPEQADLFYPGLFEYSEAEKTLRARIKARLNGTR